MGQKSPPVLCTEYGVYLLHILSTLVTQRFQLHCIANRCAHGEKGPQSFKSRSDSNGDWLRGIVRLGFVLYVYMSKWLPQKKLCFQSTDFAYTYTVEKVQLFCGGRLSHLARQPFLKPIRTPSSNSHHATSELFTSASALWRYLPAKT